MNCRWHGACGAGAGVLVLQELALLCCLHGMVSRVPADPGVSSNLLVPDDPGAPNQLSGKMCILRSQRVHNGESTSMDSTGEERAWKDLKNRWNRVLHKAHLRRAGSRAGDREVSVALGIKVEARELCVTQKDIPVAEEYQKVREMRYGSTEVRGEEAEKRTGQRWGRGGGARFAEVEDKAWPLQLTQVVSGFDS